jgi:hypothetical protein
MMVDSRTFDRNAPFSLLSWLAYRQAFGTYLHFIPGVLDADTYKESERIRRRLVKQAREQNSRVYVNTLVSPSMTSAFAQSLQIPGVAGIENNITLFELSVHDPPSVAEEVIETCRFAAIAGKSLLVLRHGDFHFGQRQHVHIWLTWNDEHNATLMVLLSYMLLGHPDWADAEIRVFAALPGEEVAEGRAEFLQLVDAGRLPIARRNIRFFPTDDVGAFRDLVARLSSDADLTVLGFDMNSLNERGASLFSTHDTLRDVLYVHATTPIAIE